MRASYWIAGFKLLYLVVHSALQLGAFGARPGVVQHRLGVVSSVHYHAHSTFGVAQYTATEEDVGGVQG
jgi:hypothetical protein